MNLTPVKGSFDFFLRFNDHRLKQKYFDYVHERSLSIIKILDLLIILGSFTVIGYFLRSLASGEGYGSLGPKITIILTVISFIVTLLFMGLSLWLHFVKYIYSDLLLCIINTFSIVFLFEVFVISPSLNKDPTLYFSYSYRFGLMNLMFVICYKNWTFKVFQAFFGSVYFEIRLPDDDPYQLCYNMILTAFCCFIFYFLEKQDKIAFKKMIEEEKQNRSWKKILNTFPEGVAIAKDDKSLVFINQSMKGLLNENDEEKLRLVLFNQIKRRGPSNSMSKFSSMISNHSNINIVNNKDKEFFFYEVYEAFTSLRHHIKSSTFLRFDRQKAPKRSLSHQSSLPMARPDRPVFEVFLTKFNEKVLEVKLAKFTYEASGQSYIIIISDVSENMRLRTMEDNTAFKNSLFASFTHEFRTPVNALFLMTKTLLLDQRVLEETKRQVVDPILFNAEILHNLVNTTSDFVAISMKTFKLNKGLLKIRPFLQETNKILGCLAGSRGLATELRLDPELPEEVLTDESRIKQILFQLYSNALKFTTKGFIKVSAKLSKTSSDRIVISVRDTGIGMNEKDIASLHRAINQQIDYLNYERITGAAGASLGLSVSNQIAKRLDKKPSLGIMFKSQPDQGSKFWFSIKNTNVSKHITCLNLLKVPKLSSSCKKESCFKPNNVRFEVFSVPEDPEVKPKTEENEEKDSEIEIKKVYEFPETRLMFSERSCEHEEILVVDDDEFNIMAVTMLLKMKGISCMAARNGQIALEIIEEQCKLRRQCCKGFGMVLMDLNMPVLNGLETAKILFKSWEESRLPWMPVILCTAYETEDGVAERWDSGIAEVVHKPLKAETLSKIIAKWMKS